MQKIKRFLKTIIIKFRYIPIVKYFSFIIMTKGTSSQIDMKNIFFQKILGMNKKANWPVHFTSAINYVENIQIDIGTAPGRTPGCYIQGVNGIKFGKYVMLGPGVGIISSNHNIYNLSEHVKDKSIKIGDYVWIGMNSVILPGVELGDYVIVAAGSVVTKSFTDGYCVIGGTPAVKIKDIDKEKVVKYTDKYEFMGYNYINNN